MKVTRKRSAHQTVRSQERDSGREEAQILPGNKSGKTTWCRKIALNHPHSRAITKSSRGTHAPEIPESRSLTIQVPKVKSEKNCKIGKRNEDSRRVSEARIHVVGKKDVVADDHMEKSSVSKV